MKQKISKHIIAKLVKWLTKPYAKLEIPICNFERLKYELRPCEVLLIEGHNRISETIKLVTQSAWSHAALYIGKLHDIDDPSVRQHLKKFCNYNEEEQLLIESVLGQGTIVSPLSKYQDEHIRICRPKGISHQDAQKVITYAINHLGKEYSIRANFDLFRLLYPWKILPRHWRSTLFRNNKETNREICSTVIAEAFSSVKFPILPFIKEDKIKGIEFIPRSPRLFTPRDFDYSPYFEIIKYPLYDLSEQAIYKQFPWTEEGTYSDGKGGVFTIQHETVSDNQESKKTSKYKLIFRKKAKKNEIAKEN